MSPPTRAALFIRGDKGNFASLVPNLGCKSIDILLRLDQNCVVVLTLDDDGRPLELTSLINSIDPIRDHYPQAPRTLRSARDSHWRNLSYRVLALRKRSRTVVTSRSRAAILKAVLMWFWATPSHRSDRCRSFC